MKKFEWYDIKTRGKKIIRSIGYSWLVQHFLCWFIMLYMWLVYLTSSKKFVNVDFVRSALLEKTPLIFCFWHNRLMMIPFMARFMKNNINPNYKFMTLASHHGDGRFVGLVMQNFGFQNIYSSSQRGRKASRGVDLQALREMVRNLKKGQGLGITPDGPRGPNQKVNGEIISIAKLSSAAIVPISYSSSRFVQFNSWDKFKLPLPFSKLCFYFGEIIFVPREVKDSEEENLRLLLEEKFNETQKNSWLGVIS